MLDSEIISNQVQEIKPIEVSSKEPSPDTTIFPRISDVDITPFVSSLETFKDFTCT